MESKEVYFAYVELGRIFKVGMDCQKTLKSILGLVKIVKNRYSITKMKTALDIGGKNRKDSSC